MKPNSQASTKALCIFTNLLGNRAMTQRLIDALGSIAEVDATYVLVGVDDYVHFRAPRWARWSNVWEGQYMARRKAAPLMASKFDFLLVNCWEYVIAFRHLAKRLPAAAVMDAVPATTNAQFRRQGKTGWKRSLSHALHDRSFARAAPEFEIFLPMGSDCADALEHEYAISRKRCLVTLAPQDTQAWVPAPRTYGSPLRLLFAGNDFARKGGEFLLRLFADHLAGWCTLTIASNDALLKGRKLPAGVQLLRDKTREQLREIYQDNDVFVLPTQQDYMPQVLAEALAMGMPCVANDVGGIRDLVRDNETGFLLPCDAAPERWVGQLRKLNHAELNRLSQNARRFAEARLDVRQFQALIAGVVSRLRDRGRVRRAAGAV